MATREENLVRNTLDSLSKEARAEFDAIKDVGTQVQILTELASSRGQEFGVIGAPPGFGEQKARLERATGTAIGETALGVFEGATLGIPREVLSRTTAIELPRGNIVGQIAGFLAPSTAVAKGVRGTAAATRAGLSRLSPGVAAKVSPFLKSPIIKGTATGIIEGAIFPQETLDPFSRGIAAAFGGAVGGVSGSITSFRNAFKRSKDAKRVIDGIEVRKRNLARSEATATPKLIDDEISFLNDRKKELIKQESNATKTQIDILDQRLHGIEQKAAQNVKGPVLEFTKKFKGDFGNRIDDALANAGEQGMKGNELKALADNAIQDLLDDGVSPESRTIAFVRSRVNRALKRKLPKGEEVTLFDPSGKPLKVTGKELENVTISNQELLAIKRDISSSLSATSKVGQFTEGDLAAVQFNTRLVEILKDNVDELDGLFNEYADFSKLSRFTFKRFRPKASEFEIPGASLFSKVGKKGRKGLNEGERKALSLIEEKTGINFTGDIKNLVQKMEQLRTVSLSKQKQIEIRMSQRIRELTTQKINAEKRNIKFSDKLADELTAAKKIANELKFIVGIPGSFVRGAAFAGGLAAASALIGQRGSGVLAKILDASN